MHANVLSAHTGKEAPSPSGKASANPIDSKEPRAASPSLPTSSSRGPSPVSAAPDSRPPRAPCWPHWVTHLHQGVPASPPGFVPAKMTGHLGTVSSLLHTLTCECPGPGTSRPGPSAPSAPTVPNREMLRKKKGNERNGKRAILGLCSPRTQTGPPRPCLLYLPVPIGKASAPGT